MSSEFLPTISWSQVWVAVLHEFTIAFLAALIIVTLHFIARRVMEAVAWILPMKVYGTWNTFLYKQAAALATTNNPVVYENAWERTSNGKTYRVREQLLSTSSGAVPMNNHAPGPDCHERHEDAKLKQFLHFVWGEAKLKTNPTIRYVVIGFVRGQKLSLVYREKRGNDSGAILLDIKTRDLMEGFEVGCDDTNQGSIYTKRYQWHRE